MTNPCEYGLKCPYLGCSNDGDLMCCFPWIVGRDTIDEEEEFSLIESADCHVAPVDSTIYKIINSYDEPLIHTIVNGYWAREMERCEKMTRKMRERERMRDADKE